MLLSQPDGTLVICLLLFFLRQALKMDECIKKSLYWEHLYIFGQFYFDKKTKGLVYFLPSRLFSNSVQGSGVKESLVFWTNVTAWLTWLEGTAEVRPAVTLTLADGSLGSAGGIDCALAPHTGLIRTALFIFAAGLSISGGSCTHANMYVKQTWCVTSVMDDIFFLPGEKKSCFCSALWQTWEKLRVCRTVPDFIRPHCLSAEWCTCFVTTLLILINSANDSRCDHLHTKQTVWGI